jgi:hypothetical protein
MRDLDNLLSDIRYCETQLQILKELKHPEIWLKDQGNVLIVVQNFNYEDDILKQQAQLFIKNCIAEYECKISDYTAQIQRLYPQPVRPRGVWAYLSLLNPLT